MGVNARLETIAAEYDMLDNGLCQIASNRWFYGIPVVILTLTVFDIAIFYSAPDLLYRWALHLPPRDHEGWHLLSSICVHFDTDHLYMNMFTQLVVGSLLEFFHGPFRVLTIYICAGVIGGAMQLLLTARAPIYIAGASGAIYGLMGAFGADLFFNWKERPYPYFWLFGYVALFTIDAIDSLTKDSTGIALWAHYTGALSGLLFAIAVARNIRIERYEPIVRFVTMILDIVLLLAILLYTLLYLRLYHLR